MYGYDSLSMFGFPPVIVDLITVLVGNKAHTSYLEKVFDNLSVNFSIDQHGRTKINYNNSCVVARFAIKTIISLLGSKRSQLLMIKNKFHAIVKNILFNISFNIPQIMSFYRVLFNVKRAYTIEIS